MARRHRPDLVAADVMMPGLDGFALLNAIRADEALASTPVALVTAHAGEEDAIEGRLAGANDYIVKRFFARELIARVAAQLEPSRARRRPAPRSPLLLQLSRFQTASGADMWSSDLLGSNSGYDAAAA